MRTATWLLLLVGAAALARGASAGEQKLDEDDMSTLTEMLHWSLSNQDLDALHAKAEAIRASTSGTAALPASDDEGPRISRIDEAEAARLAALKAAQRARDLSSMIGEVMPDRAQQMRDALANALGEGEAGASEERRVEGLHELEELVEDIDNARDFVTLGGFARLVPMLAEPAAEVQSAAAWVLGSGAQNNAEIQAHLCEIGAPAALVSMLVGSPAAPSSAEVDSKALYALSAIARDSAVGAAALVEHNGLGALALALRRPSARVVRKALTLLTDLARNAELAPAAGRPANPGSTLTTDGGAVRLVVHAGGDNGGPEEGALALSLEAAIASNASAVCDAIAAQLEAGLKGGDVDTVEKAVEAADALISSARFGPHIVGACARSLGPRLSGSFLPLMHAAAGGREKGEDEADADRAALWAQVASTATRLHDALAVASATAPSS